MDKKDIEDKIKKAWEEEPTQQPQEKKEASWEAFSAQAFPAKKKRTKPWKYAVAAIFIVTLSVGAFLTFNGTSSGDERLANTIIENPTQRIKLVHLPDSSIVELEPNSKIEYNDDFKGNRKINLEGKAFFKVQKDKKHPFQVFCQETTTTVLGTSFTIAGDVENIVNVKLYEGSVRMNVKNSTDSWILAPGEEFIYNSKSVSVEAFNRFKDFDNEELATVIKYVKQNYDYQIEMPEGYLKKEITLRVNQKEELSNIISIIAQMYNLNPTTNEELKKITFK